MSILIKPMITEKSMALAGQGVYTFMVALAANKNQIKEAVQGLFAVNVTSVTTTRLHTAEIRTGRRRIMKKGVPQKIARVSLKKGQKIELFDLKEEK